METSSRSTRNKRLIVVHHCGILHSSYFSISAVAMCKSFLFCLFILCDMSTRLRDSLDSLSSESGGRVYRWPWETAGRLVIFICCLVVRSCGCRVPCIVVIVVVCFRWWCFCVLCRCARTSLIACLHDVSTCWVIRSFLFKRSVALMIGYPREISSSFI
jgi:hypothetical protein